MIDELKIASEQCVYVGEYILFFFMFIQTALKRHVYLAN